MFKWLPGRQGETVYHKFCLSKLKLGKWGMDVYLLRYPPGTTLLLHRDRLDGKHWRMNLKLWGSCRFVCTSPEIFRLGEVLHIIRPDICEHGLVVHKKTFKLSVGVARFNN